MKNTYLLIGLSLLPFSFCNHLSAQNSNYYPEPEGTFKERQAEYLQFCAKNDSHEGIWRQIARLELGQPVDEQVIRDEIDFVYSGEDVTDFTIGGLLRLYYKYGDSDLIPGDLKESIKQCILDFKYWWDDGQQEKRCYYTENHQIIYHSDQLLAGQLFPKKTFSVHQKKGHEHTVEALQKIRLWLDWRIRFGFSEWLSNTYFAEDIMALTNLRDFALQPDIRKKSEMLLDMILFEMAMHSWRGIFGSTHGRAYASGIHSIQGEGTANISRLVFGMGMFNNPDNMGAVSLATSSYRCPPVIKAIAGDLDKPMQFRERNSLEVEDAPKYGLSYTDPDDIRLFFSMMEYTHPLVIDMSQHITSKYKIRDFYSYGNCDTCSYKNWRKLYQKQIKKHGEIKDPLINHKALSEVNIKTYRHPDYLLSSAQDYRPGRGGYQQHIWQATLGPESIVYTNHPGSDEMEGRPNYWVGNGTKPRVAQHKNVLVSLHKISKANKLPFSHAYFPSENFEKVLKRGNWILGKQGNGYIALYTQNKTHWVTNDGIRNELRVDTPNNFWICELGSKSEWGSFEAFTEAITSTRVQSEGLQLKYRSPSEGMVTFGWKQPLTVKGKEIPLDDYPRFDNPYCKAEFPSKTFKIEHENQILYLDFTSNKRIIK